MDSELAEPTNQSLEQILRRRGPLILLCIIVVAGAAYGYSKQRTKKYTASASLSFNNNPLDQQIVGLSGGASAVEGLAQQNHNRELVRLGDTAAKTARQLGDGLTASAVSASLSINSQGETSIIDVQATSTSPTLAAAIANSYATQFVKEQQSSNREFFTSALALVNKQLARLSPVQRIGSDGLDLQERAHTLSLLADLGYNNAELAQEAQIPSGPSSPKTKSNTALGAALGLFIGLGLAFLLERLDHRIREPEDLEAIYGLPMLGHVPKSSALSGSRDGGKALPPVEAEAFSLIRAHLRFFNVDREVRTVIVASPAPGDGKSTIARYLAEAAARSGSRVLLLEVDLRHPTFAQQLGISSGTGLAEVLIGTTSMDQAIHTVHLPKSGDESRNRTLDILVAGAVLPPNPSELLESQAMDAVLRQAKYAYDLVVIDTPPLTAVSDAFPLLTKVDGVIIVGWVGRSRRDDAERLQQVLAGSGAPLLGVIASGAKPSGLGSYADRGTGYKPSQSDGSANSVAASEGLAPTIKS